MSSYDALPVAPDPALPAREPAPPLPLSERTRHALGVGGAALGLGVLGDLLLRPSPWGINLALWTLALVAAAAALQGWSETEDTDAGWIPLALAAAALMAWRDSPTLKALDLAALCIVLGLALHRARGGSVRVAGVATYVGALALSAMEAALGAFTLLGRDVAWREIPRNGWSRHALAAARGVALALPLLLLFGALLASADAAFERLLSTTFNLDAPLAVSHLMLGLTFAWVAAGILRPLVLPTAPLVKPVEGAVWRPSLGIVELGTVLGLLDLLFLSFVVVQLPYFFGGAATVEAPGTTTYAEYARRGFFELVTVAGLVLPLLLGTHWLLRRDGERPERVFRVLAGVMVGLVFVMIVSALHRMRLYQAAYGLTELRVYTTAFMLWLSAVFAWLCVTVLRGRRERFAFGATVAALEALVVLHAVNPDALIVRVNTRREAAEVRFDARYAASLSADAVPALLAALPRLPEADRCLAAERLLERWDGEGASWRTWSLGRGRALHSVAAREAELRELACVEPVAPPVPTPAPAAATPAAAAPPAAPPPAVSTLPPAGAEANPQP